jgi:two-component system response regulator YesN
VSKRSILLVEDDANLREVTRIALERDQYDVIEAPNYAEAVRRAVRNVDAAVVDFALPDRDGLQVAAALRRTRPGLPVILMAAYGNEDVAVRALRAGVSDYIRKPFRPTYLMERVSAVLEGEVERRGEGDAEITGGPLDGIGDYIREHCMKDLSLSSLARMASMSKFRFCRLFKEHFGENFVRYVNKARIETAVELLGNHHLTVSEIAYFVGFKTVGHFERVFKALHGVSPREYRRKLKTPKTVDYKL